MQSKEIAVESIYVICTVRRDNETNELFYIPVVTLGEDLKSYTIAASNDLMGVQLKNQQMIQQFAAGGVPTIILPISPALFREIGEIVSSSVTQTVNGYLDIVNKYNQIVGILGSNPSKKGLPYYLYEAVVGQRPFCIISSDMQLQEPRDLDIILGLEKASSLSDDESDSIISETIEVLEYGDPGPGFFDDYFWGDPGDLGEEE